MNPASNEIEDLARNLRGRVDSIEAQITKPSLDEALAGAEAWEGRSRRHRPTRSSRSARHSSGLAENNRHQRNGRPAIAVLLGAVALLALPLATYSLTHEDSKQVRTTKPAGGEVPEQLPLLAPPGDFWDMTASVEQDSAGTEERREEGTYETFISGEVGQPARLLTLISFPRGADLGYPTLEQSVFEVKDWFNDEANEPTGEVRKVGEGSFRAVVVLPPSIGASEARPYSLATNGTVDAVILNTGLSADELADVTNQLRWNEESATIDELPQGFVPFGVRSHEPSMLPGYSIRSWEGLDLAVTGLADAGRQLAYLHRGQATVLRAGPGWVIRGSNIVYVIREGALVVLSPAGSWTLTDEETIAMVDNLRTIDRATLDSMRGQVMRSRLAEEREQARGAVPIIDRVGRWLPTELPEGAGLQIIGVASEPGAVLAPELAPLWSPSSGTLVTFRSVDPAFVGLTPPPTRTQMIGDHLVEYLDITDNIYEATVWPTARAGVGQAVLVRAMYATAAQLDSVLSAISKTRDSWEIEPVDGLESLVGMDEPKAPAETSGYYLWCETFSAVVMDRSSAPPSSGLVGFLSGRQATRTTIDGEDVYTSLPGEELSAVFFPATATRPEIMLTDGKLSLKELIEVGKSFAPATEAELQTVIANLGR